MKICFVDTAKLEYSSKDINSKNIRGGESSLINLSKNISKFGNDVYVFNNCKNELFNNKYNWLNINRIKNFKDNFDIIVSNNDTKILSNFNCNRKFVLSHSILTLEKSIRKGQLLSYFLNKPKYLLLGNYHKQQMSKVFSLYGSQVINYGVDEIFEKQVLPENIDENLAFFTSRQDRNLNILIEVWKNKVFKKNKNSRLLITPVSKNYNKYNIYNRKMLDKHNFIKELVKSRMVILPGHKAELYCIAALEALELCLPVVTMGIGSLSERVDHGKTGLISKSQDDFADNINELFNNNSLWSEIKSNLKKRRGKNSWINASYNFLKILKK